MFIVICQDIFEQSINSNGINKIHAVNTLKMILLSVKWRKHIVFAPELKEEDIGHLENLLTSEEVKLLKFVHLRRQDSHSLMKTLSVIAYITFEEPTQKEDKKIVINPRDCLPFELFEETHFIVENILDSFFYIKAVCKYYQRKNSLKQSSYSVAYYPVQGGGSTISEVIKMEIDRAEHFCFVIGDSDKKCNNYDTEGNTAKGIRSEIKEYENRKGQLPFNLDYYIMSQTREIENLIPNCILEIFSNNKEQKKFLKRFNNSLAFFDFKVGMEYKILFNDDVYNHWKTIFSDVIDWDTIDRYKASSANQAEFETKLEEHKLPKLVDGWGKSILNTVLNSDKKKYKDSKYRIYEIKEKELTSYQKDEWEIIGKNVFSWCCCFANPVY